MFTGLNPSTADAHRDDPTIRRCRGFAQHWGFGGVLVMNLFAYRATDPARLKREADPIGPENDAWLQHWIAQAARVVVAWGIHGQHRQRGREVLGFIGRAYCLGLTRSGEPRHPLYVRGGTPLQPFGPMVGDESSAN